MSSEVLFVAGSPSPSSRSSTVGRIVAEEVERAGLVPRTLGLRDFDATELLLGQAQSAAAARIAEAAKRARAIVVSSPMYKATYSGGLKAIVDLIPPDALGGKPALGIATTRLDAHGPLVDYAYRALFAFFSARTLETVVVLDSEFRSSQAEVSLEPSAERRARAAGRALVAALGAERPASGAT
jgi:FMN reductase